MECITYILSFMIFGSCSGPTLRKPSCDCGRSYLSKTQLALGPSSQTTISSPPAAGDPSVPFKVLNRMTSAYFPSFIPHLIFTCSGLCQDCTCIFSALHALPFSDGLHCLFPLKDSSIIFLGMISPILQIHSIQLNKTFPFSLVYFSSQAQYIDLGVDHPSELIPQYLKGF